MSDKPRVSWENEDVLVKVIDYLKQVNSTDRRDTASELHYLYQLRDELRDSRTDRDKWKQSYEYEQEDAHKLRERVRELEKPAKNALEYWKWWRQVSEDYNALCKAVRDAANEEWFDDWETLAEKREDCYVQGWNDCVQQITESGSYSDAHLEDSESGDADAMGVAKRSGEGRPVNVYAKSDVPDDRPAALGQLLVRDGVPYRRAGIMEHNHLFMHNKWWHPLTDLPADVPYKLAWEKLSTDVPDLCHLDGLYDNYRVGVCRDCGGARRLEDECGSPQYPVEPRWCRTCHGDGGRYELRAIDKPIGDAETSEVDE